MLENDDLLSTIPSGPPSIKLVLATRSVQPGSSTILLVDAVETEASL